MAQSAPMTQDEQDAPYLRQRGVTSKFLDSKGFGWLMEVDTEDEEHQKPLLLVL